MELDVTARSMKSSPVSCSSSPRSAKTELVTRGGIGGTWTELVIPEVVSELDLKSELDLQGAVVEPALAVATRSGWE